MPRDKSKRLTDIVMGIGGILLIIGAALPIVSNDAILAPYVYMVGAVAFCGVQLAQQCNSENIVLRRLYRQQKIGAVMLLTAAVMMLCSLYGVSPFDGSEWQLALSVGAVIELYCIFRISHELGKNNDE